VRYRRTAIRTKTLVEEVGFRQLKLLDLLLPRKPGYSIQFPEDVGRMGGAATFLAA
jgi:hypothetical protein